MVENTEKNMEELKSEYSARNDDLDAFLKEKLKMNAGQVAGSAIDNRRTLSIRAIVSDKKYFETGVEFLKKGFALKSEEKGLTAEDGKKFEELVSKVVETFEQMHEKRQDLLEKRKPDTDKIYQAKSALTNKIDEFSNFISNSLHTSEGDLYSFGKGNELGGKNYISENLRAKIDRLGAFNERLEGIETGFQKLSVDIGATKEDGEIFKNLIEGIKELHKDYFKSKKPSGPGGVGGRQ